MSETARLFTNSLLTNNMTIAYFLGILFALIESKSIKDSFIKALRFAIVIFLVNILGWIFNYLLPTGFEALVPALFFVSTMIGIAFLSFLGELEGEYLAMPKFLFFLAPLFGSQWLIQSANYNYPEMVTATSGHVLGFYLIFVFTATIKEKIIISDASPVFKRYSTVLAALAMLAMGIIGFHLI